MSQRREAEIVVIGAGIWGLSVAYQLGCLGFGDEVLVMKHRIGRQRIGFAAVSWRNSDITILLASRSQRVLLARLVREFCEAPQKPCGRLHAHGGNLCHDRRSSFE